MLNGHGYRTSCAVNGEDALRLLHAGAPPCVILLDLMMPVMDGWTFRERQLAEPGLRDIPVIVLTAHADASQVGEELSAAAFLAKPVALASLLSAVERVCKRE